MRTKILLGAALVAIVTAACQMVPPQPPDKIAEDNCNGANKKCVVTVTSVDSATRTGVVDIDGLKLDHGFHNLHIFWRLKAGCFFDGAAHDGVLFKNPGDDDGQFIERFATDDENDSPAPNSANGKKYHWKGKNDSNAGHKYRYKMIFHCDSGPPYVIDPWIQNG